MAKFLLLYFRIVLGDLGGAQCEKSRLLRNVKGRELALNCQF